MFYVLQACIFVPIVWGGIADGQDPGAMVLLGFFFAYGFTLLLCLLLDGIRLLTAPLRRAASSRALTRQDANRAPISRALSVAAGARAVDLAGEVLKVGARGVTFSAADHDKAAKARRHRGATRGFSWE